MSHRAVIAALCSESVLAWVPHIPIPIPTQPCRVSDSSAPPGLSLEAQTSQGSCGANLLHGISGMAWLGSARRAHSGAGRACFVSPGPVLLPVCVLLTVQSWFFCVLRSFMITWWLVGLGGGFCS